jgi:hypothetical protein
MEVNGGMNETIRRYRNDRSYTKGDIQYEGSTS